MSTLNITTSLYFQYSEMPCSNLFPGCLQGYYRSFGLSNRQEMWSSSFGLCVSQRTAPTDLCVTARGSVTAPIQLKITFVRLFLFQLLWTFLSEQKHSPLFRIYAYVVWKLCHRPVGCYFPHELHLHLKYSSSEFNRPKGLFGLKTCKVWQVSPLTFGKRRSLFLRGIFLL